MAESDQQQLRHLLLIEDTKGKRVISLETATYTLGRDRTNSIVIYSKEVSRQHAILLRVTKPGSTNFLFRVIDGNLLGKRSTNGIAINGKRCFSHDLQPGEVIQFGGRTVARYYVAANWSDADFEYATRTGDLAKLDSPSHDPFQTILRSKSAVCLLVVESSRLARARILRYVRDYL